MVLWLFYILMIFAGLTALCALWAIFYCVKDAASITRHPVLAAVVRPSHDVERNELARFPPDSGASINSTVLPIPSLPSPQIAERATPVASVDEQLELLILPSPTQPRPSQIIPPHNDVSSLSMSPIQDESSFSIPAHSAQTVPEVQSVGRQNPGPAQSSTRDRANRRGQERTRLTRTVVEPVGYRMIAVLVPADHEIFNQRGPVEIRRPEEASASS